MLSEEHFSGGGNCSLESRLQSIRGRLSEVNSSVRKLESNMIFLLVHPELLTYTSNSDGDSKTRNEYVWEVDRQSSVVMSNPRTDYGQEEYTTNSSELHSKIDESMSLRYELMISEGEISDALYEEKKQWHSERNDLPYDDSKTIEHHSY